MKGQQSSSSAERVAVIGAGLMGAGIAQSAAEACFNVVLIDIDEQSLARGFEQIDASLPRRERAGNISESSVEVRARIESTTDLESGVRGASIVIEAIPEIVDLKIELFKRIEAAVADNCLIASNTSQISISELAAAIELPERFIGLHFYNPVPVMGLIEVIPGLRTSGETLEKAKEFAKRIDKRAIVAADVTGFIATRVNMALCLEAMRALDEGVGTAADIDATFRIGFGHPMGPLALCDYVGLDTVLHIATDLQDAYGERFLAPPVLKRTVAAGYHGRKSGRGFYDYDSEDAPVNG